MSKFQASCLAAAVMSGPAERFNVGQRGARPLVGHVSLSRRPGSVSSSVPGSRPPIRLRVTTSTRSWGADHSSGDRPPLERRLVRGGVLNQLRAAAAGAGCGAPGCSACSRCSRTDLVSGPCCAPGWSAASAASRACSSCSDRPASRPRIGRSGRPSRRLSAHDEAPWPLLLLSLTLDSPRRSSRSRGADDPGLLYGDVTDLGAPANWIGMMRRMTWASARTYVTRMARGSWVSSELESRLSGWVSLNRGAARAPIEDRRVEASRRVAAGARGRTFARAQATSRDPGTRVRASDERWPASWAARHRSARTPIQGV